MISNEKLVRTIMENGSSSTITNYHSHGQMAKELRDSL